MMNWKFIKTSTFYFALIKNVFYLGSFEKQTPRWTICVRKAVIINIHIYIHTHVYIYICIYIYMDVCEIVEVIVNLFEKEDLKYKQVKWISAVKFWKGTNSS